MYNYVDAYETISSLRAFFVTYTPWSHGPVHNSPDPASTHAPVQTPILLPAYLLALLLKLLTSILTDPLLATIHLQTGPRFIVFAS